MEDTARRAVACPNGHGDVHYRPSKNVYYCDQCCLGRAERWRFDPNEMRGRQR